LVNFSEKELYKALGFFVVVAIALLTLGLFSKNNLLVNTSVAIGTISMAIFVAYQASLTRKSIEEIRKERLFTPIKGAIVILGWLYGIVWGNLIKLEKGEWDNISPIPTNIILSKELLSFCI